MAKIAVSSCLIGKNTKYDGGNNDNFYVKKYLEGKEYVEICPEILGGLSIPRSPCEIQNEKVINKNGIDVTINFEAGANKALKLISENNIDILILKSKSPSCGFGEIYDGNFTHTTIKGNGVFVNKILEKYPKIKIYTEEDIKNLF